jgi:hypothetical protein
MALNPDSQRIHMYPLGATALDPLSLLVKIQPYHLFPLKIVIHVAAGTFWFELQSLITVS